MILGVSAGPAERYQGCVGINRYHIVFEMKFKMLTLTTLSLFASVGVYRRTLGTKYHHLGMALR